MFRLASLSLERRDGSPLDCEWLGRRPQCFIPKYTSQASATIAAATIDASVKTSTNFRVSIGSRIERRLRRDRATAGGASSRPKSNARI